MRDLTTGPISGHVVAMSVPMAAGMFLQTLYYFVDLYFVAKLGDAALAGVSAAGTVMFIVFALTQTLGVGTVALVSHAVGRKDRPAANLLFNQSVALGGLMMIITLVGGYALAGVYMTTLGADEATVQAGTTFLYWFIPGLALQFPMVVMGSALRGTGIVKPTMVVQMLTVLLNVALAPVLIAGWGTGHPLGVAGAALATTIAALVGDIVLAFYFVRLEKYVSFDATQWKPRAATWKALLNVGVPSGGEFAAMALFTGTVYWILGGFGTAAQAGFGIGSRVMQMLFLPAMAVAFAAAPIAGQNFGARHFARVRETFRVSAIAGAVVMFLLTIVCQFEGATMARIFTSEPEVIAVTEEFLSIISWNFVAMGVIFTCSSLFQGLGNTWPSLASVSVRVGAYVVIAIWLSRQPGFEMHYLWYLSIATATLQVVISLVLLRMEFRKRLG
ncbi:MATE family efflux transporter [Usitatibacter palustris]|uniref:Multidrug export protein MepA n=1 Tax=Usitatibacter palustris TaxID=2732487 RepID=A0A6M4H8H5_9PROT|nr:MATE family efflux transporter [Usitatibacter palustris]QJR15900.1 Multidrug export protein MepA [Usitatibacter palustris]